MSKIHQYNTAVTWTGNEGSGTSDYKAYSRNHVISANGKPEIPGSSDPAFRGDVSRYNPEDSLVAACSACHMLWYLHLCAVNHVVVVAYRDNASGTMVENPDGSGQFREIILRPEVTVTNAEMIEKARALHSEVHKFCCLARSLNFPIHHQPEIRLSAMA